jgi:predicted histone-like DNA-binding protein
MKVKKSKHVHHYRDGYTPVVRCHLSRRHKVAGADKDAWCTGVSVAFPQKIDIEQMALDISNATTATPTDVKLVWDALRTAITDALCEGHRVQLDGLGLLTMELSNHTGPTPPTGKDVQISGIRFRPDKHLLDRLADVKFKVEGKVKEPLAAPELADALYEYFETHDDISVREFARINHYAPSTAYKKLGEYVAYGEMERVPRISGCFRPTPGHFGREE